MSERPPPSICLVTRIRGDAGSAERTRLVERLAAAAAAGADVIQIRERLLSDRELAAFTASLVEQVSGTGCRVLVNDRTDVALAAGAHGVHLKSDGPSAGDVRRLVPPGFIVGRSIHSVEEAVALSREGGYDYLLFGTVFPSESKPDGHRTAGLDALRAACAAAAVPVIAIGGIDVERARLAIEAGAAGIAAIALFAGAADLGSLLADLRASVTLPERSI
jgi:thiamine-phosphate diphosphorylase